MSSPQRILARASTTEYEFADLVMGNGALAPPISPEEVILGVEKAESPPEMSSSDVEDADDEHGPISTVRRLPTRLFSRTNTLDKEKFTEAEIACLKACKKQKEALLSALVNAEVVADPGAPTKGGPAPETTLSQRVGASSKLWNSLRTSLHNHFRHIRANLPDDERYQLTTAIEELKLDRLDEEPHTLVLITFDLKADYVPEEGSGLPALHIPSYFTGTSQGGEQPDWDWHSTKERRQVAEVSSDDS